VAPEDEAPALAPSQAPARGAKDGFLRAFVSRVQTTDVFFFAGAITFNVLVAIVPLVLLLVGGVGFFVGDRFGGVSPDVVDLLVRQLPQAEALGVATLVERMLEGLVAERAGVSLAGAVILAWISTRLAGTLRVVLRNLFEISHDRGLVAGKLFDFKVVLGAGALVLLNFGVTLGARAVETFGGNLFWTLPGLQWLFSWSVGTIVSLATAWILFFLLYRYLPARRVVFRAVVVGATFATLGFELLKVAFAWYVTSVANYANAYGSLAAGAVLFFWIYYSAILFIIGGILARTVEVRMESTMKPNSLLALLILGLASATALGMPVAVQAQSPSPSLFGGNGLETGLLDAGDGVVFGARNLEREIRIDRPLIEHDGPYVVVHLAENRVFLMEGTEVVWSAPAGTGTGLQLVGDGREWLFTTPKGMFQVLRKEKDPIWVAPDWHFVQRGLSVPAFDHPSRFIKGTLGTSALFLGDGIAIHGTDRPDLLLVEDPEARRVSAGCIRLTNEAARQLYHRVTVGTPVLIY